jgi:hypothetical protein
LIDLLLECTDATSRMYVGNLVKFILNRLKMEEKSYLYETEKVSQRLRVERSMSTSIPRHSVQDSS